MNTIVVANVAQADVDKIVFDYPPRKFLNEPANVEEPKLNETTAEISDNTNEVSVNNFKLLRGPRHDEFDWNLAKVSDTLIKISFEMFSFV